MFDTTRADRIIRWFRQCIQTRGVDAGRAIELQPWQIFDLSMVYGFVDRETGARRFKICYSKVSRGNFKSTTKSGQVLYHMCADAMYPPYRPELASWELSPEVLCAAVDRGQAMRVFGDAKEMGRASPNIAKRLQIPKSNPITHLTRGGFAKALSKDTRNKDSAAPSYMVLDEYHSHTDSSIMDVGLNSFGKRPQALLDIITTAGDGAEGKPCFREEQYAKQVLSGELTDERYAAIVRELDEKDNPHDKGVWCKANPCLRYPNEYSKYMMEQIETEYTAAYGSNDPYKIRAFLTRRMNLWQAESVNSYLDARLMELARKAQVSREEFSELTDGRRCHCGFDLGKRIDLSGTGAVFPLPDGRYAIKAHGFLPENAAARHEQTDRVPYIAWARGGYCTLTPGDVTDNGYVDNWICAGERDHGWKVDEVDYDGHNATDLAIRMCGERNNADFCVEVSQTCAGQNLAVKGFRELLLQGRLVLEENPLLVWCLGNAVEIQNNFGDVKLNKKHKDDSQRIDPLAAVMNALARVLVAEDKKPPEDVADKIRQGKFSF